MECCYYAVQNNKIFLDSKVHGANMGPIWGREDPGGPHVGPMNFTIWVDNIIAGIETEYQSEAGTTKDAPNLALTGKLWGVFWKYFGEHWPRYNSTALYKCYVGFRPTELVISPFHIEIIRSSIIRQSEIIRSSIIRQSEIIRSSIIRQSEIIRSSIIRQSEIIRSSIIRQSEIIRSSIIRQSEIIRSSIIRQSDIIRSLIIRQSEIIDH